LRGKDFPAAVLTEPPLTIDPPYAVEYDQWVTIRLIHSDRSG